MNRLDAAAVLHREMDLWRKRSYADLVARIEGEPDSSVVTSSAGVELQIAVQVFWDGARGGDVRVLGSVDDGGLSAFKPLSEDFILASDGSFVGEDGDGR